MGWFDWLLPPQPSDGIRGRAEYVWGDGSNDARSKLDKLAGVELGPDAVSCWTCGTGGWGVRCECWDKRPKDGS